MFEKVEDGYFVKFKRAKQRQNHKRKDKVWSKLHVPYKLKDSTFSPAKLLEEYLNEVWEVLGKNSGRVFWTGREDKYIDQVLGKNSLSKLPKEIAKYLKLDNANRFVFHSFRRTAATIASEAGMSDNELCDYFNWMNPSMAREYTSSTKRAIRTMGGVVLGGEKRFKDEQTPPPPPAVAPPTAVTPWGPPPPGAGVGRFPWFPPPPPGAYNAGPFAWGQMYGRGYGQEMDGREQMDGRVQRYGQMDGRERMDGREQMDGGVQRYGQMDSRERMDGRVQRYGQEMDGRERMDGREQMDGQEEMDDGIDDLVEEVERWEEQVSREQAMKAARETMERARGRRESMQQSVVVKTQEKKYVMSNMNSMGLKDFIGEGAKVEKVVVNVFHHVDTVNI